MASSDFAFDDFLDDCFIKEDPLCEKGREASLELIASQLIAELIEEDDDQIAA